MMNTSKNLNNMSQAQSKELNKSKSSQNQTKNRLQANNANKSEKTIEEEIFEKDIQTVEKTRLSAVFNLLCGCSTEQKFGLKQLTAQLTKLEYQWTKQEVEQMIWEVDEDLDEFVISYEFELMYKRCIFDKTGLEPRNLFNLVQFLMYDEHLKQRITVEDTLELLYVRYGRANLDEEIKAIFGKEEKTADGQEKEITFTEYLVKMRQRDFDRRQQLEKERKTVKKPEEIEKQ